MNVHLSDLSIQILLSKLYNNIIIIILHLHLEEQLMNSSRDVYLNMSAYFSKQIFC